MKYNFERIDRKDTDCIKWDGAKHFSLPEDVLPLWVADMDFPILPEITKALEDRIKHPIIGYTMEATGEAEATCEWMKRRHGMDVKKEWILTTPGIVTAFKVAISAFTKANDPILIIEPEYHPIKAAINQHGRKPVIYEMKNEVGRFVIDFKELEAVISTEKPVMLIFSTPHNPVGRIFSAEELKTIGELTRKYNMLVFSDEIHMDFAFAPHRFVSYMTANEGFESTFLVATSSSKTFNIAGLNFSNIIVPDEELRNKYLNELKKYSIDSQNLFGSIATKAAYENGDLWVDELHEKLQENFKLLKELLSEYLPKVKLTEPEGLYLAWLDFNGLGLTVEALNDLLINKAKVWLNDGSAFGKQGEGFQRMNLATSGEIIKEAVLRISNAIKENGLE
ncbi:MAG: MalY/PatB family protein [Clostridiaceae bacterium]